MRRLGGVLAAVATVMGGLVLVAAAPAAASQLTVPDSSGGYFVCISSKQLADRADLSDVNGWARVDVIYRYSCNFADSPNRPTDDPEKIEVVTTDGKAGGSCSVDGANQRMTCSYAITGWQSQFNTPELRSSDPVDNAQPFITGSASQTANNPNATWLNASNVVLEQLRGRVVQQIGFGLECTQAPTCNQGSATQPPFPVDYYPGGVAGTGVIGDPPAFTVDCSRVLSIPPTGDRVATFATALDPLTGTTDTFSWDFGDSTTSTVKNPQHVYTGTQPDRGWTATLTVTRTGDGTTFLAGPVTAECALRVDFLNPDQSDPLSPDSNTDADDNDCPSGWGWLNPLAIVKILKCLFIPGSTTTSQMGDMFGEAKTKAPFSIVDETVSVIPAIGNGFEAGVKNDDMITGPGCWNFVSGKGGSGSGAFGEDIPTSQITLPGMDGSFQVGAGSYICNYQYRTTDPNGDVATLEPSFFSSPILGAIRTVFFLFFLYAVATALYTTIKGVLNGGG